MVERVLGDQSMCGEILCEVGGGKRNLGNACCSSRYAMLKH
jgi:hypothetical protein